MANSRILIPKTLDRFCSVRSQAVNDLEPLAGSAMQASTYVFISWPKTRWARRQFESRGFPPDLAAFLGKLQKERHIFTRLFKAERAISDGKCDVIVMGATEVMYANVDVDDVGRILREHFDGGTGGVKIDGLTLFCCTHGKRDLCCAKFGLSVVHTLREVAAQLSISANVFECTHIGADRFAATAVSFPHRFMFGRLRADNAVLVLSSIVRGQPYIPCYRGRLGMSSPEQIAETFGFQYLYVRGILDGDVLVQHSVADPESTTVNIRVVSDVIPGGREFQVLCTQREFVTYMDCDGVSANETRRVRRWVFDAVQDLSVIPSS